jgi:hypothetical protein
VALAGALLVTLATPATWPLALGAFLLRGGIVLVVLPIIVLPTPVGLANALGPVVTSIALGSVTGPMIAAGTAVALGIVAILLGGAWLAATLEAEAIRIVSLDEDVAGLRPGPERSAGHRVALRILVARLIAHVPLLIAFAWGSVRLVSVAYRELTSPFDVVTPIAVRVLRATPEVIAAVIVAWMIGEIIGAMAARRIVLDGDGVRRSLTGAIRTALRRPIATLARFWGPTLILLAVLVPAALAVATAWTTAADALGAGDDLLGAFVAVAALVLSWTVGLLLLSVVCGWRAAEWTVAEVGRAGTFGGSADSRPGDWRPDPTSATL